MRLFVLAALAVVGYSAEYQTLTLTDGRILTGEYDRLEEVLLIDGKASMRLSIRRDQVAKSEPAHRAVQAVRPVAPAQAPNPVAASRAEVDAAGAAYYRAVLSYYQALLATTPRPVVTATNDNMTVRQVLAAQKTRQNADAYDSCVARVKQLSAERQPIYLPLRASAFDFSISASDGTDGVAARSVLNMEAVQLEKK